MKEKRCGTCMWWNELFNKRGWCKYAIRSDDAKIFLSAPKWIFNLIYGPSASYVSSTDGTDCKCWKEKP